MVSKLWWIRNIALTAASLFFLGFGVQLLFSAYRLSNPFFFVLTFFSSNFIILISAALLIGFVYRMWAVGRGQTGEGHPRQDDEKESPPDNDPPGPNIS